MILKEHPIYFCDIRHVPSTAINNFEFFTFTKKVTRACKVWGGIAAQIEVLLGSVYFGNVKWRPDGAILQLAGSDVFFERRAAVQFVNIIVE